jgi:hypothetical protein
MGMASSLPVLFPDRPSACGWLYGALVIRGEVVSLPTLTVVWFRPPTEADLDPPILTTPWSATLCGSSGPLWFWSDMWAGFVSVSGLECEACIRVDDSDPTQGWVPSPLAITAG